MMIIIIITVVITAAITYRVFSVSQALKIALYLS